MKRAKIKTTIRIPGGILSAIQRESRERERSQNDLIVETLRDRYGPRKPRRSPLPCNQA